MLDGGLGPCIRGVVAGERGQQRGDNGDELAAVADVLGAILENEERRLGVDAATKR